MGSSLERTDGFEQNDSGINKSLDSQPCDRTLIDEPRHPTEMEKSSHSMTSTEGNEPLVRRIGVDMIVIPETHRKASKKVVMELVKSIGVDGLLQPICVRLDPEQQNRYLLVFGRHRLEAVKMLGEAMIEAKVLDVDVETAERAMHAENLWRNTLKRAEFLIALKAWYESYRARFPEVHGKRAGGEGKKRAKKAAGASADSAPASDDPADEAPPTFTETAAEQLGVSQRGLQKQLKVANALSSEDLMILDERGVGKTETERLAAIPDQEKRRHAVRLIASGLSTKEAIATATLPVNTTFEQVGDRDAHQPTEDDLSDDEWLETFCGEVLAQLKYQAVFQRDALLYRQIQEARRTFRNASMKALSQGPAQLVGPFYAVCAKFVNVDHPSRWQKCGVCDGTGIAGGEVKDQCGNCRGAAYAVKTSTSRSERR